MMTALETANAEQRAASNPAISAFVSASAGSGKTKLLTDRLLRLMLAGTRPERILCLTFTKAAAAEMAIRLNRRLGEWVVMPEAELDAALAALDVPAAPKTRHLARQLFADVLDLPGGMRIETIHAFCQSLLRRFPLEAELSPHFELEEEVEAQGRLRESRELALADVKQRDAIMALAAETDERKLASLTSDFAGKEDVFSLLRAFSHNGLIEMQRAALGANELDEGKIIAAAVNWPAEEDLKTALRAIADVGTDKGKNFAYSALDWLAQDTSHRAQYWQDWHRIFFKSTGEGRKTSQFFGAKLKTEKVDLARLIEAEQTRICAIEDARKTARLAILNAHLLALTAPILQSDSRAKTQQARVSYADLIAITLSLLAKPEDVAWILYKLDGGIDHLLLDEVQDTAPAQWRIADAIAGEFFAGQGAREIERTIFAVGDPKQSIFAFQGADLKTFQQYQDKFRARVRDAGKNFLDGQLSVSFRSTAPVLALVDAVFAEGPACEGVCEPGALTHSVSRLGQAGRVTLWPLAVATQADELPRWAVPDDYTSAKSAKSILAETIAQHIKKTLGDKTLLPSRGRAVTAGDFLILVRKRDELIPAITKACKALNIPIAGADRMALTVQQAVSDLLALCDALLLPEDDLAFAQFLASPLGGLSDDSLMHLALNRPGTLSAALFARRAERADWAAANGFFQTLRTKVDFISPHALLAEALGPLSGRAKLLQRLGLEAAEPIDELLAEALAHARRTPASLQNFLFTLRQSSIEIKREPEAAGDTVRIMTVHGAKGLQAPIVILPDTTGTPTPRDTLFWLKTPQHQGVTVPIFCPRTELRSQAITEAVNENKSAQAAEQNRLLYVALTRAEDELIICGAKPKNNPPVSCWYNLVEAGFTRLGATTITPQTAPPDRLETLNEQTTTPLPAWAGMAPDWRATPPPTETTRPEPLAPSRNTEDAAKLALPISPLGESLASIRVTAMEKGRAIHALLQHLPDIPVEQRRPAAVNYLARLGLGAEALEPLMAILESPSLMPLFAPGSRAEVPLAGILGDVEIGGLIDRLMVSDEILLADYKTDRSPPATPQAIPSTYLRQLAAYAAILRQIYPEKPIAALIIWTQTATVMAIPAALLAAHAPTPAQPYAA